MYEAIILAGGFGTRLREAVPYLPKPMAPIAGKPFLAWQVEYLIRLGVTRFIFSVGYRAVVIQNYFGTRYGGADIVYVIEAEPLGTGGATKLALESAISERVFVFNGDTICDINLEELRALVNVHPNSIGMCVKHVEDSGRYGSVIIDSLNNEVLAFGEKSNAGTGLINAGIYDLPRNLFVNHIHNNTFSFEAEVLQKVVKDRLYAVKAGAFFIDIGVPSDFENAQALIPKWAKV